MEVYLETERLILRRLSDADVDNLTDLDADPDVMFFTSGGRPTPREEILDQTLPALLTYYERYALTREEWERIAEATNPAP